MGAPVWWPALPFLSLKCASISDLDKGVCFRHNMPMNTNLVRAILSQHTEVLRTQYAVRSLALFGSVARGEATESSDVDLLAEFSGPVGYFELAALQEYLSDLLGRPVDLGTMRSLKPRVRMHVEGDLQRVF